MRSSAWNKRAEALEKAKAIALSQLPAEVEPVEMTIVSELAADQNSVWVQVVLETEEHIGLFVPMQEPEP